MTESNADFLAEITSDPLQKLLHDDHDPPCRVLRGDVLEVLRDVEDDRFHAVLCDPPYGLSEPLRDEGAAQVLTQWIAEGEQVRPKRGAKKGFMGAQWDSFVPGPRVWAEVLRVTRPGGYLLAFAGSRTSGWMEISLMLAGWEVLDTIQWWYAEGFPKGGNVGRRVDEALGHPHARGELLSENRAMGGANYTRPPTEDPKTSEGAIWDDWSTTLKPAHEPIIVARKPLSEKSVATNLLRWRTGAMNIGACRVNADGEYHALTLPHHALAQGRRGTTRNGTTFQPATGRWPANLMLTHSEACGDECAEGCPVRLLDEQSGQSKSGVQRAPKGRGGIWSPSQGTPCGPQYGDKGGASRFFFCAKASPADRVEGAPEGANKHPTVKPVPLIRELARLVTPQPVAGWTKDGETWRWEDRPPGEVLVPFAGSGSEVVACALEGLRAVGIEREAEYLTVAEARIARALECVRTGITPRHWRRRGE